jgi:hypothetical protein
MEIQMDKDLEYIFAVLPSFGTRYSNLVMGYACLFGVTPFQIKAKKMRLIMEEMKKLFDAQAFTFQKKKYDITHAGIAEALDVCIKKNFEQHLENHNYLKKVMVGISEREGKDKSRSDEKDLRNREQKSMAGYERPAGDEDDNSGYPETKPKTSPRRPSAEDAALNRARVAGIIKSIG